MGLTVQLKNKIGFHFDRAALAATNFSSNTQLKQKASFFLLDRIIIIVVCVTFGLSKLL